MSDISTSSQLTPRPERYVSVTDSLFSVIPRTHIQNVKALLRHERDMLRSRNYPDPRQKLMNYYPLEKDSAVYVVFQGGEFQGFNNRRAMARIIDICKKNDPKAAVLVHRMGAPLDYDLVRRLDLLAENDPENWIMGRSTRTAPPDGEPPITINLSGPS